MASKKIFIVDDEPLIRGFIRDLLEAKGYEVKEAEDYQQGLRLFAQYRPHLAIIDNVLPDGSGLELLREFKKIDGTAPLILMTGYRYADVETRALEAGAVHFLMKPFDLDTILKVIEKLLPALPQREY